MFSKAVSNTLRATAARVVLGMVFMAVLLLPAPVFAEQEEPYTKEQKQTDCETAGATYFEMDDGTWGCDFPEGEDIICDANDNCELGQVVDTSDAAPNRDVRPGATVVDLAHTQPDPPAADRQRVVPGAPTLAQPAGIGTSPTVRPVTPLGAVAVTAAQDSAGSAPAAEVATVDVAPDDPPGSGPAIAATFAASAVAVGRGGAPETMALMQPALPGGIGGIGSSGDLLADPGTGSEPVPPIPPGGIDPGPNQPPDAPKTLAIIDRTTTSISLRWRDRSAYEEGTELYRKQGAGDWVKVAEWGPLSDWNEHTDDSGLAPDTHYCYRFRSFNSNGHRFSPQRCAYTKDALGIDVWRVVLVVRTGDVDDAGTDDDVVVRLNSASSMTLPAHNHTWLDYGRDDFERDTVYSYDLDLTNVRQVGDITLLSISKTGSDGWCIQALTLMVNGRSIYGEDFSSASSTCMWLDDSGGHSNTYTVSHEALRAHPQWVDYTTQIVPWTISRDDIESRIEGMVGHLIHDTDRAYWGHLNGPRYVEASTKDDQTVHIDLDLAGEAPGWFDPEVDVQFDLRFEMAYVEEQDLYRFDVTTQNLEVDVDFDWLAEALSFILPCGPIVSVAKDEGIPNCIEYLEDYIADKIRSNWQPIAEHMDLDPGLCGADARPTVSVDAYTYVVFGCEPVPPPDGPEFPGGGVFAPAAAVAVQPSGP